MKFKPCFRFRTPRRETQLVPGIITLALFLTWNAHLSTTAGQPSVTSGTVFSETDPFHLCGREILTKDHHSSPASQYYIESIYWQVRTYPRGDIENLALLTIDDAPNKESTPGFLDLLDQYDARALFFINGEPAQEHPDLIEAILDRGHQIGNHTWSHSSLLRLDRHQTEKEIVRLNEWLQSEMDYSPRFFRPPYGNSTAYSDSVIAAQGMRNMGWSVAAYDWLYPENEQINEHYPLIAERTMQAMYDGVIILIHDWPVTLKALKVILQELEKEGYELVDPAQIIH